MPIIHQYNYSNRHLVCGCRSVLSYIFLFWIASASSQTTPTDKDLVELSKRDAIILVGGGNVPDNSQGQIELNVQWVLDVIQRNTNHTDTRVLYTDGQGESPDVKIWQAAEDLENPYQPLARVFGANRENGFTFQSHRISDSRLHPADKQSVTESLTQSWDSNSSAITFIYNGHGSFGGHSTLNRSALKLWNDERLSVSGFSNVLDTKPAQAEFRFILTQCYSGAFAELAWDKNGKVCGFMAESPFREAEGCSASIDSDDYRDYTTFFYAAIDGKDRHGSLLNESPDLDQDGTINFREAHLYTLTSALSNDLSRSTSEVYLEEWEPWFLRWRSFIPVPNNEYSDIANQVAKLTGIKLKGDIRANALSKQQELLRQQRALMNEQETLQNLEQRYQKQLQDTLLIRWPQVQYPRTSTYQQLIKTELSEINKFIFGHPNYSSLKETQNRLLAITDELLQIERLLTQVEKFFRLRKLARLKSALDQFGSESDKLQYKQLLGCETNGRLR